MRNLFSSLLIGICMYFCCPAWAVEVMNAGYDGMIERVTGLYEELIQQEIELEHPSFLVRHNAWIEANVEVCGADPQVEACLTNIRRRIQYMSQLKTMLVGLRSVNQRWESLAAEASLKLPTSAKRNQAQWVQVFKMTCIEKTLSECEGLLRQRDKDMLAVFLDNQYSYQHKEHFRFYQKHFDQVMATVLAVTPAKERHQFALNIFKQKKKNIQACSVISRTMQRSAIAGRPLNQADVYRCQWQSLRAMALKLDERLVNKYHPISPIPTGEFSWLDGVGVWVTNVEEPISQQGTVGLNSQQGDVHLNFNYTGINGAICDFSATFKRNRVGIYSHTFNTLSENEKCELEMQISPNFLHFKGVNPQSSCSAALGCGFRAYLPDDVPLLLPPPFTQQPILNGAK